MAGMSRLSTSDWPWRLNSRKTALNDEREEPVKHIRDALARVINVLRPECFLCSEPSYRRVSNSNFSRSSLRVVVNDFRGERENSYALVEAIRNEIENSLSGPASNRLRFVLTVDVIEHRSFFTLGNWHATTRLRWRIERTGGQPIREGIALGEGHR